MNYLKNITNSVIRQNSKKAQADNGQFGYERANSSYPTSLSYEHPAHEIERAYNIAYGVSVKEKAGGAS